MEQDSEDQGDAKIARSHNIDDLKHLLDFFVDKVISPKLKELIDRLAFEDSLFKFQDQKIKMDKSKLSYFSVTESVSPPKCKEDFQTFYWNIVDYAGCYIYTDEENNVIYIGKGEKALGHRVFKHALDEKDWLKKADKLYGVIVPKDVNWLIPTLELFLISYIPNLKNKTGINNYENVIDLNTL